jgi:aryl-alcohol dehydrogenase-like predicted oxidoreductase
MTNTDDLRFALGTIPFGTRVGQAETFELLDRFVAAGGTMIDTANNYPFWYPGCTGDESESVIGDWLAARRCRDRVMLSTKVGARPRKPGDTTLDDVEGLSPNVIRAAIRSSLTRLRTDRIDIYWAHIDDRTVPLAETVGAFDELVRSGLAGTVGASNMVTWRMEEARAIALPAGQTPYTAMQLRHTYVRPHPGARGSSRVQEYVTDDTLDYLSERPDVALWAYSTLLSGAYTRADRPIEEHYRHPGTDARLAVLAQISAELGVSPNQVVLAWLMADGIIPIVGVSTSAQLDDAIAASRLRLDADVRQRLDAPR